MKGTCSPPLGGPQRREQPEDAQVKTLLLHWKLKGKNPTVQQEWYTISLRLIYKDKKSDRLKQFSQPTYWNSHMFWNRQTPRKYAE